MVHMPVSVHDAFPPVCKWLLELLELQDTNIKKTKDIKIKMQCFFIDCLTP